MSNVPCENKRRGKRKQKTWNGIDRSAEVSYDNFPICPAWFKKLPKECEKCEGELNYPSCNARYYMLPELKDPLKFHQLCTPMGGGGGD